MADKIAFGEGQMIIAVITGHTPSLRWFRMDMMHMFLERGHTVYALGNEPETIWENEFAKEGIIYRSIEVQRNGTNPFSDIRTLASIKNRLKVIRPDKVFAYQAKTIIYGTIAARQLGIQEVYPMIAGLGSVYMNTDLKSQVVKFVLNTEYRYALRTCPAVFFQNREDVASYRENRIIKDQKVVMIPGSGVNTLHFSRESLPSRQAFLCISRLIRDKGVGEYLEACRIIKQSHPDVRCMLVGPFDTNPSAISPEKLQPYLDDGIVEYFGEQKDVRPYLKECTVFVLPSYREGTPKTVLEAMAVGRACITTDAPGCRETVVDGKNGFLIPIKDAGALAEKMEEYLSNPVLAEVHGTAGRTMAEQKFDVEIVNRIIADTMCL